MDLQELVSKIDHSMPEDTTLSVFADTIMSDMKYSPIRARIAPHVFSILDMIRSRHSLGTLKLKNIPVYISNVVRSNDTEWF